jgi:hypothetical protein
MGIVEAIRPAYFKFAGYTMIYFSKRTKTLSCSPAAKLNDSILFGNETITCKRFTTLHSGSCHLTAVLALVSNENQYIS